MKLDKQVVVTRTSIQHDVSWKEVPWEEVYSGLRALRPKGRQVDVLYNHLGAGYEVYLEWSQKELSSAESDKTDDDKKRHLTNAMIHARRAVDNMLDDYLRRYWLSKRLKSRPTFFEKLNLLMKIPRLSVPRELINALISAPRNDAEHNYRQPTYDQTVQAVQAATHVINSLTSKNDPLRGRAFFGSLLFEHTIIENEKDHLCFNGFAGPFALTWKGSDEVVRVGIGISEKLDFAEVLFCKIEDISESQHFELLEWWESKQSGNRDAWQEPNLRERFQTASLDGPIIIDESDQTPTGQ